MMNTNTETKGSGGDAGVKSSDLLGEDYCNLTDRAWSIPKIHSPYPMFLHFDDRPKQKPIDKATKKAFREMRRQQINEAAKDLNDIRGKCRKLWREVFGNT